MLSQHVKSLAGKIRRAGGRKGTPERPIRIGLLWHSLTSGNLGIGALTYGNIAIARKALHDLDLHAQFVVIGMRDGETSSVMGNEVETHIVTMRTLLSPNGLWKVLGGIDCVLDIGAGDSFTDTYGWKRFLILCAGKVMAVCRGIPLVLSPQTVGPFNHPGARAVATVVLRRASAIVTRDPESLALARELAPRVPCTQSIDVSFTLPHHDRSAERDGPVQRVGVNVSGLLFRQAENGTNRFGLGYDYARFSRALLRRLCAMPGIEVHLLTHATSRFIPSDDDARVADLLHREFPEVIRVPNFPGPVEAKSYISSLDFLAAARMHACIAAFCVGTPFIPVAYTRKFSGLFSSLGFDRTVPVDCPNDDHALDLVLRGLSEKTELLDLISRGHEQVENLLGNYRSVLRDTFATLALHQDNRLVTPQMCPATP
ncbi:polysaccharide pyruvyl transferase [Novosphingobium nitrogenifigens DSM 19370]|uniref:Polysaccharide pyruvyl transferase n=1 Tax=Novosphingobium nitrogenifigens DSM 19370 TaxID=983920 RepID=F1Z4Z6_9SPHN|nr:polysaccharide pyruvyl transferase family protein [Novosphingobium nitrogenifigens]EGD59987.1 polysaccharide pyruvyl transferase [Novosphingobium nitrogenifigens DSM 19370]